LFEGVRWFWDLTRDFWAVFDEKSCNANKIKENLSFEFAQCRLFGMTNKKDSNGKDKDKNQKLPPVEGSILQSQNID
jgi:hypothetical protein